jgi:DNA/RNA endonuclease G (NUC1)
LRKTGVVIGNFEGKLILILNRSILVIVAFWVLSIEAQTVHISHCLAGCPEGSAASNDMVVHNLFVASISPQSALADWVAYRILEGTVGVASLLPREWSRDNLLDYSPDIVDLGSSIPTFTQPDLTDQPDRSYRITEMAIDPADQGRLVPFSSYAGTPYWSDLNQVSNMAPMRNEVRVGPWSRLDQAINELAALQGELFVISGPIYQVTQPLTTGASNSDNLPSEFFKVVANGEGQLSAFLFRQEVRQHEPFCDMLSNLQTVEQLSGLDLLPQQASWPVADLNVGLGC